MHTPQQLGDSHEALTFHATPDTANPKDAAGRAKVPLHLWPASATAMGSVGLLEGELKYGRNNFRATPVCASVYVAALKRHVDAWMEGQDVASDTGSPHLGNALACLAILVDAQANGTLIDDRNYVPKSDAYAQLVADLTAQCAALKEQFKDKSPKHWDARDRAVGVPATMGALHGNNFAVEIGRCVLSRDGSTQVDARIVNAGDATSVPTFGVKYLNVKTQLEYRKAPGRPGRPGVQFLSADGMWLDSYQFPRPSELRGPDFIEVTP